MSELKNIEELAKFMNIHIRELARGSFVILGPSGEINTESFLNNRFYDPENNWEQLMEIVEKVETLRDKEYLSFTVVMSDNTCRVDNLNQGSNSGEYFEEATKKKATFMAMSTFVQWWNLRNN
jgi:hypothetical protein